jgi:hypothetical protein
VLFVISVCFVFVLVVAFWLGDNSRDTRQNASLVSSRPSVVLARCRRYNAMVMVMLLLRVCCFVVIVILVVVVIFVVYCVYPRDVLAAMLLYMT